MQSQMQGDDNFLPNYAMPVPEWIAGQHWLKNVNGTSWQALPPDTVNSIDTRSVVHNWLKFGREMFRKRSAIRDLDKKTLPWPMGPEQTSPLDWQDMNFVLQKMANDITDPSVAGSLEVVGLMSHAFALPSVEDESSDSGSGLMALGVFSREVVGGNSAGSLRKMCEEQFGVVPGGDVEHVPVFAVTGLSEAPNIPASSATVLLAKIAKWAQIEQRLVVVPRHALHTSDGSDLTSYYVRLGFDKMNIMDDGSYDLVYSGTSTSGTEEMVEEVMVSLSSPPQSGEGVWGNFWSEGKF